MTKYVIERFDPTIIWTVIFEDDDAVVYERLSGSKYSGYDRFLNSSRKNNKLIKIFERSDESINEFISQARQLGEEIKIRELRLKTLFEQ